MKSVSSCIACGGETGIQSTPALVAPFLARRIWGRESFKAALLHCERCGFAFFNPRMEADEESRLYAGYRDAEYRQARQECEPWYTEGFNAALEAPDFLSDRKEAIRRVLQPLLKNATIRKVLDFGGARGEVVLDLLPGATPYVYDISQVAKLEGVTGCSDLEECAALRPDLVISSNVLEHVGDPSGHIELVRQVCAPETLFWIEVPKENPFGFQLAFRRMAQFAILTALRPRLALTLLGPGLTRWMHEHVNYFTEQALVSLLTRSKFKVLSSGHYDLVIKGKEKGQMIWALAVLAGDSPD